MERNKHNRDQMRRALRAAKLWHCVTISVIVVAAVVLSMLVWYLLAPSHGRVKHALSAETVTIEGALPEEEEETDKTDDKETSKTDLSQDNDTDTSTSNTELSSPTASDGTGQAGVMAVTDNRSTSSGISGWQNSDGKLWYEVSKSACYYGGWKTIGTSTYYFDSDGYAAVGWKSISYQNGCYFDSNGVYVPDKDKSKMICLTFDTAPSEYTDGILDILSSNGAKATFFIQGSKAELYGDVINRIVSLGNTIGNYSYSGSEVGYSSAETVANEFSKADEIISDLTGGIESSVVRFPGGYYTKDGAAAAGKPNISWNVETYDLETEDENQIAANIYAQLQAGIIIRMHDVTETDLNAVKKFVPELVAQGWEFVTIEDMAASRGYELEDGVTYLGFTQEDLEQGKVNDK